MIAVCAIGLTPMSPANAHGAHCTLDYRDARYRRRCLPQTATATSGGGKNYQQSRKANQWFDTKFKFFFIFSIRFECNSMRAVVGSFHRPRQKGRQSVNRRAGLRTIFANIPPATVFIELGIPAARHQNAGHTKAQQCQSAWFRHGRWGQAVVPRGCPT